MKKGFTLIELMGVLILLAIISLIAVPVVLNLINDSREEAKKRSLDNYIHAVNLAISSYNSKLEHEEIDDMTCNIQSDGNLDCNGTIINVNVKNTKPASGIIVIKDYEVSDYYGVSIDSKAFNSVEFNGTKVAATEADTHKGIVYLDPTDLSATCNATLAAQNLNENNTPTGIKTGCMKFYIYDDSGSSYKMILDHSTSSNVIWNSSGNNSDGPNEVLVRFAEDTQGWAGNPRLITANEVAHIVGADIPLSWSQENEYVYSDEIEDKTTQVSSFFFDGYGTDYTTWYDNRFDVDECTTIPLGEKSKYAWLFDNTNECLEYGCNVEDNNYYYIYENGLNTNWMTGINGYWTSSVVVGMQEYAWSVRGEGYLGIDRIPYSVYASTIRPVIELSKTLID